MQINKLYILLIIFLIVACGNNTKKEITPWGTPLEQQDSVYKNNEFGFNDIMANGEIIMLTMSGENTYYDYHGRGMGLQYLLCEKFAQTIGVSLRVEVCRDSAEMIKKLINNEGDIVAYPLTKVPKQMLLCGVSTDNMKTQWAVKASNKELADTLKQWFKPQVVAQLKREERFFLSNKSVVRRVYSPMLNRSAGVISHYDAYFKQYAPMARFDWRLMAAQCYQESTFDPHAKSWAGASGLMQIMPSTARHLGLGAEDMFNPELNIAAAAKYLAELGAHFKDVQNPLERMYFVLAGYNGGHFHIRDAMALARKNGRNAYRWSEVAEFVLKLQQPQFYNDAVVKYGYMRGSETVDYVERISNRWAQYRGVAKGSLSGGGTMLEPRKSKHKNKYEVK